MLAMGTFVLGKEKESRSDTVRMFTATEWAQYWDRKANGRRHKTRFVTLKFMGFKKDEILNWNEGDTVFVCGVYEEEPYMGKLDRDGEQQDHAENGYEPRSGASIMVESIQEVQFSKESKTKLDIVNGTACGWGQRDSNGGASRGGGSSPGRNSGGSGNGGGGYGGQQRSAGRPSANQRRYNDQANDGDGPDDDEYQDAPASGNNRQQQSAPPRGGQQQSRTNSRPPAREPEPEQVNDTEFDDLELPDT